MEETKFVQGFDPLPLAAQRFGFPDGGGPTFFLLTPHDEVVRIRIDRFPHDPAATLHVVGRGVRPEDLGPAGKFPKEDEFLPGEIFRERGERLGWDGENRYRPQWSPVCAVDSECVVVFGERFRRSPIDLAGLRAFVAEEDGAHVFLI